MTLWFLHRCGCCHAHNRSVTQYHPRLRPQVICDEGRLADAQVDIRSCRDVARDCGGQFVAIQGSAVDVLDPLRTFACGHRLTSRILSTKMPGVITFSGSI